MSTRCNFAKNCIVNAVVLSSKTFAVPITLQPYECVCLSYQLRLARDGDGFTAKDCPVSYSLEVLNIEIGTSIQINRVYLVGTKIRSFNSKFWKHQVIEFEVNYSSTQSKPVVFSTTRLNWTKKYCQWMKHFQKPEGWRQCVCLRVILWAVKLFTW